VFRKRSSSKPVAGLDLDPGHVAAAEVIVNGHVAIARGAAVPLRPGVVRDGELADPAELTRVLSELFEEHELPRRVRIGLANQRVVVRTLDLPPLDDEKALAAAVRAEAPDVIPMPMDEVVLDFQPLGTVDTADGPRARVIVVAVRRETVERIAHAARDAGLELEGIDLSAFAMVRALMEPGAEHASLYVNVAGLTNVAVAARGGVLFTRTAPGGLDAIVESLAERRSLTLEHARQWLRHVGLEQPLEAVEGDADVVAVTRATLEEGVHRLADSIRTTLNYYRMQDGAEPVERAVLTGPAIDVPGFCERLSEQLDLPVARGELAAVDGVELGETSRLTVAAGLAVHERT
jgi:type IV pilus assembly protein PilM